MNNQNVSITEAARNFSDFVNRVAYRQESFFLIRGKKPVAELRPVVSGKKLSELPGLLNTLPSLTIRESELFISDLKQLRSREKRDERGKNA